MVTETINRSTSADPKQFVLKKNVSGGLAVVLEAHDFSVPARKVVFNFNENINYVTTKYALGVFVTPSALRQLEKGYFTFEKLDTLIKMAEELGYYVPDSIKDPQLTLYQIADALRSGKKEDLDAITTNLSTKVRADIIAAAHEMYTVLQQGTIAYLEKKLRVSLKPVNLRE